MPQEPFLFHGTIRDNIAFARPDATDDEIARRRAARSASTTWSTGCPTGSTPPVHERGSSLSSGERQLLALARAFLARPRVLVLDEATSNLDLRSEAKIEQALDVLLEGRTAIIIAHRLATAMRADRIAVVDDGGIVELGTHDELVARGGATPTCSPPGSSTCTECGWGVFRCMDAPVAGTTMQRNTAHASTTSLRCMDAPVTGTTMQGNA